MIGVEEVLRESETSHIKGTSALMHETLNSSLQPDKKEVYWYETKEHVENYGN